MAFNETKRSVCISPYSAGALILKNYISNRIYGYLIYYLLRKNKLNEKLISKKKKKKGGG
jgi:hypothetical protein